MKIASYHTVLLLALLCLSVNVLGQHKPASTIPDFTFRTLDGRLFSKKDLVRNKKIVFVLFDVTCDHCQHEMQAIGKRYNEFKNIPFYLVSMDTPPAMLKFMGTYGKLLNGQSNVTLLHDYKPEFIQKFMPDKYPAIFVYSEKGFLHKYMSGQKDVGELVKALK